MTPLSFLNHVDERANPHRMSDHQALIEIHRRGLYQRYCNLNERERKFLRLQERQNQVALEYASDERTEPHITF
jgi:hypothetical protein